MKHYLALENGLVIHGSMGAFSQFMVRIPSTNRFLRADCHAGRPIVDSRTKPTLRRRLEGATIRVLGDIASLGHVLLHKGTSRTFRKDGLASLLMTAFTRAASSWSCPSKEW
jgi:hypothetical protein